MRLLKDPLPRVALVMLSIIAFCHVAFSQDQRPNIIYVMVDDMGFSDAACYGGEIATPNLDRLAASGVRLDQFYVQPVCSPTRAALMTGKHPARLHITDWIAGHQRPFARLKPPAWTKYLPREETTIAEALKLAGTVARVGRRYDEAALDPAIVRAMC